MLRRRERAPGGEERSPKRGMCAAILSLEAVVLGLTTPVMINLADVRGTALVVGLGLCVACLLLAGMLRSEAAYVVGWVIQVAAIGLGFVVPMMFVLGAIFGLLWGTAYFLGRKIERERAEAYAAYDAEQAAPVESRTMAARARSSSSSVHPPKPMITPLRSRSGSSRGASGTSKPAERADSATRLAVAVGSGTVTYIPATGWIGRARSPRAATTRSARAA